MEGFQVLTIILGIVVLIIVIVMLERLVRGKTSEGFEEGNGQSTQANLCCDIYTTEQLSTARAKGVDTGCNPYCDRNGIDSNGKRIGCLVSSSDFDSILKHPSTLQNPHSYSGGPIVTCDGVLN